MREDEVVSNLENWLVMLNVYSQQGKLEDAERVLEARQEAGFCADIIANNTMVTGYGKAGKNGFCTEAVHENETEFAYGSG